MKYQIINTLRNTPSLIKSRRTPSWCDIKIMLRSLEENLNMIQIRQKFSILATNVWWLWYFFVLLLLPAFHDVQENHKVIITLEITVPGPTQCQKRRTVIFLGTQIVHWCCEREYSLVQCKSRFQSSYCLIMMLIAQFAQ